MSVKTERIGSIANELTELNRKFYNRSLLCDEFYRQLMQAGFAYRKCLLMSIFPDGGNTYCGKLIKQDGKVVEFDIDLDNFELSSWEDVSLDFQKLYEKDRVTKPWSIEVVSFGLFSELEEESDSSSE